MKRIFKTVIEFIRTLTTSTKRKEYTSITEALKNEVVEVVFRKANGELSTKIATKKIGLIPESELPKGNGKSSESVITFFSILDEGWRSMKADAQHTFRVLSKNELKKLTY